MDFRRMFSRTSAREHTSTQSQERSWFSAPAAGGLNTGRRTNDVEVRTSVAQHFMAMNEAHDRIRTQLLTHSPRTK